MFVCLFPSSDTYHLLPELELEGSIYYGAYICLFIITDTVLPSSNTHFCGLLTQASWTGVLFCRHSFDREDCVEGKPSLASVLWCYSLIPNTFPVLEISTMVFSSHVICHTSGTATLFIGRLIEWT